MNLRDKKIGVIGGSQGLGSWMVKFFREENLKVSFSSADDLSEYSSNKELVEQSDVVMLAVPISKMVQVLEEIFPFLHQKIFIEICSVKKFIVDRFEALLNENPELEITYYSIHPMFSQRLKNLKGQVFLFNHQKNGNPREVAFFSQLFTQHKAIWFALDYTRHDKIMGIVQGLNHFNVFVSAKTLQNAGFNLEDYKSFASPPYRIFIVFFTRYVLQNPQLYAEIQLFNEYVLETLKIFKEEVDRLFAIIETKNEEAFISYVSDMQPYFEKNVEDSEVSNHLIEQLGRFVGGKKD